MKHTAKLLALVLALATVMTFGLTFVSAADDDPPSDGSITINNAPAGQTYNAYKIFDLKFSGTAYTYKIKQDSPWYDFVKQQAEGVTAGPGAEYIKLEEKPTGSGEYVATWKGEDNETRRRLFAQAAKAYLDSHTSTISPDTVEVVVPAQEPGGESQTIDRTFHWVEAVPAQGENQAVPAHYKASNLLYGYYLVDTTVGTLCFLTSTDKDAAVNEKNELPSIEKQVKDKDGADNTYADYNSAEFNEIVQFKTVITIPAEYKGGAKNYILHDKMCEGLIFCNEDGSVPDEGFPTVTVTCNNTNIGTNGALALGANAEYTIQAGTETTDPCTFEIVFNQANVLDKLVAGNTITVVYYAKIDDEKATIGVGGNSNDVKITVGDSNYVSGEDSTKTYIWSFDLIKYTKKTVPGVNSGDPSTIVDTPLPGAVFELYKDPDSVENRTPIKLVQDSANHYHIATPDDLANNTITKVDYFTTDDTGAVYIKGLEARENNTDGNVYYLHEKSAPEGYNPIASDIEVIITQTVSGTPPAVTAGDFNHNYVYNNKDYIGIENNTGNEMPSVGGTGTKALVAIGSILVLVSVIFLVTKKKMSAYVA